MASVALHILYEGKYIFGAFRWHSFEVYLGSRKLVPQQGYRADFRSEVVLTSGVHQLEFRNINKWTKVRTSSFFEVDIPNSQGCTLELGYSRAWGAWSEPIIRC